MSPSEEPKSRQLLRECGIGEPELAAIARGDMQWDLLNATDAPGESDLVLFGEEGGHRFVARLTPSQADELLSAWDYERRSRQPDDKSSFPPGTYDDWAGVSPDSDWESLVRSYRSACTIMRRGLSREATEPWLFLCRHTIELQLKAIVMLGQDALGVEPDLPDHHNLKRLWTAASPFFLLHRRPDTDLALRARAIVEAYDAADNGSYSFRYPVTRANARIKHSNALHQFSPAQHADAFERCCNYLGDIIRTLRVRLFFRGVAKASAAKTTSDPMPRSEPPSL